jgi:hypothetical protein
VLCRTKVSRHKCAVHDVDAFVHRVLVPWLLLDVHANSSALSQTQATHSVPRKQAAPDHVVAFTKQAAPIREVDAYTKLKERAAPIHVVDLTNTRRHFMK